MGGWIVAQSGDGTSGQRKDAAARAYQCILDNAKSLGLDLAEWECPANKDIAGTAIRSLDADLNPTTLVEPDTFPDHLTISYKGKDVDLFRKVVAELKSAGDFPSLKHGFRPNV